MSNEAHSPLTGGTVDVNAGGVFVRLICSPPEVGEGLQITLYGQSTFVFRSPEDLRAFARALERFALLFVPEKAEGEGGR